VTLQSKVEKIIFMGGFIWSGIVIVMGVLWQKLIDKNIETAELKDKISNAFFSALSEKEDKK
jgi:hypothetical protein